MTPNKNISVFDYAFLQVNVRKPNFSVVQENVSMITVMMMKTTVFWAVFPTASLIMELLTVLMDRMNR